MSYGSQHITKQILSDLEEINQKSKSDLLAPIASGIKASTADPNLPAVPVIKIELLIK